jgi:hypothetical protein
MTAFHRRVPPQFCKWPDRDVPAIRCGYPLPCRHHTADGKRIVRILALINPTRHKYRPEPLVAPRIFDIRLGTKWESVCEKYLGTYGRT